jgi:hypothetical protein
MNSKVDTNTFVAGDEVVLAHGTYQGTQGAFVRLTADNNWACIEERSGRLRNHPVAWLAHAAPRGANPGPMPAHLRLQQNDGAK